MEKKVSSSFARSVTIWLKFPFSLFHSFTVKPIAVHITTREKFVSAEKRYDVECKSSGSRPEAVLTWWKGSRQIKRMAKNVSCVCCHWAAAAAGMRSSAQRYHFIRTKSVCCNFNDVCLTMPEMMSQQQLWLREISFRCKLWVPG